MAWYTYRSIFPVARKPIHCTILPLWSGPTPTYLGGSIPLRTCERSAWATACCTSCTETSGCRANTRGSTMTRTGHPLSYSETQPSYIPHTKASLDQDERDGVRGRSSMRSGIGLSTAAWSNWMGFNPLSTTVTAPGCLVKLFKYPPIRAIPCTVPTLCLTTDTPLTSRYGPYYPVIRLNKAPERASR